MCRCSRPAPQARHSGVGARPDRPAGEWRTEGNGAPPAPRARPSGARAPSCHVDGIERQRSRVGELPGEFGAPQKIIHRLGEPALPPVEPGRQWFAGHVAVVRDLADGPRVEVGGRTLALEAAQTLTGASSSRRPPWRELSAWCCGPRLLGDQRRDLTTGGPGLRSGEQRDHQRMLGRQLAAVLDRERLEKVKLHRFRRAPARSRPVSGSRAIAGRTSRRARILPG